MTSPATLVAAYVKRARRAFLAGIYDGLRLAPYRPTAHAWPDEYARGYQQGRNARPHTEGL
jgi:hypothetical protein